MSVVAQVIPEAKALSRVDKLRLIQVPDEGLAGDEGSGIEADRSYAVWSPDCAFDAADVMLRILSEKGQS